MRLLVVGCNHKTAPIALRERLSIADADVPELLGQLKALNTVGESIVLSTCNRTEVYAATANSADAVSDILSVLQHRAGIDGKQLSHISYSYTDEKALAHVFRVASSLDALVVGEAQIGGQVRRAYSQSKSAGSLGPMLTRCMERAFYVAKRVRTETAVAQRPASVASVAIDVVSRIFEQFDDLNVLLVGAGEMGRLAAKHLKRHGVRHLRIANRTRQRAEALAADLGATLCPLDTLSQQLTWADVVVTSTASPAPLITTAMMTEAMRKRRQRLMLILDIAVPRDVEADVATLDNVYTFTVDDLQQVVADNIGTRHKEAAVGEQIVAAEVGRFAQWYQGQKVVPLVKELRRHFSKVLTDEADRFCKTIHGAAVDDISQAQQLMVESAVNKLLHQATVRLKNAAGSADQSALVALIHELFPLADDPSADDATNVEETPLKMKTQK